MKQENTKSLPQEVQQELLRTWQLRFEKNRQRHAGIDWLAVQTKLEMPANAEKCWSLSEMEETGGEPDVIGYDKATDTYIFCDCSAETPKGRRSICYDREALDARKEFKPANCVLDMAAEMGIDLLTEEEYRALQLLGSFDTKTSSWVVTPPEIRKLGGAIFCDRRYNHVFTYHNGADSYYGVRGFRGKLRV
ncbi:MAG: DUF4256 domain-containing protein [Paludibacter sp.]|nr:DUF4256 domain-containing protein [Paludibacter sp.]